MDERKKFISPFPRYCISPQGLLKWLALIFTIIVFCLVLAPHDDDLDIWILGEEFTIITCTFTMAIALLYLILFFLGCHRGYCYDCGCNNFGYVFYFLGMIMWFISAGVETYATVFYRDTNHTVRYNRRAAAAVFTALILGLILAEHDDSLRLILRGERYTAFVCAITLASCLLYLLIYTFGCHEKWSQGQCQCQICLVPIDIPYHRQVFLFYILATAMWFAAAGVETHATVTYKNMTMFYRYRQRAAAAGFSYLNGATFGAFAISAAIESFQTNNLQHYGATAIPAEV